MDRAALIESLESFRAELREADRRVTRARAEADALRKVVEGIEGLIGGGSADQLALVESGTNVATAVLTGNGVVVGDAPRGQAALRRILIETVTERWKRGALLDEVQRRGWFNPDAKNPRGAASVALDRLVESGEVLRENGFHRYNPDWLPPSTPTDGDG
jgi:hypothetical protein